MPISKIKKIITGLAASVALISTGTSLVSCGHHSTLSIINKNADDLFGGKGLFVYKGGDATLSSNWTNQKSLSSGNYIIATANSGQDNTWKMLFDYKKTVSMPSNGHEFSVMNHPDFSNLSGGALMQFLDSKTLDSDKFTGDWLRAHKINVAIVEYKAPANGAPGYANKSKSDRAKNYLSIVNALSGSETGGLTFLKGSSKVSADKDKRINPSSAQFNFSQPSDAVYQTIFNQLKNIYGIPRRSTDSKKS